MSIKSLGKLQRNNPLAVLGVINAYSALQATKLEAKAIIYLSGSGIASASYGLPDLGIVGLEDVLIDVRRITSRVDTPLLVDVDARFGGAKWSFCDQLTDLRQKRSFGSFCISFMLCLF